jgi:hypothetical protein
MAGSWIKLRHDALDAPELRRVARATGLDCDQVLGKLARLWSWADRHGVDGLVKFAELEDVDSQVGHIGFGTTLVSVGWLAANDLGVVIPNWERHFSDSAKARALGASRVERHRNAGSVTHPPDDVTLEPLPEKTETKEDKKLLPLPREGFDKAAWQTLRKAWNSGPGKAWKPVNPHPKAVERLAETDWLAEALLAVERLSRCRFFRTPVSLGQFCGPDFVTLCNGGEYDDRPEDKKGDFANTPPPPKAFTGDVAEAFERTRKKLEAAKEGT